MRVFQVGRVIIEDGVEIGGNSAIDRGSLGDTVIGAMSGIHQFVRIGGLAMVGAMSRVCNDVPPFMLASGAPPKLYGLNSVGLRRAGIGREVRQALKQAFQLLYRRNLS